MLLSLTFTKKSNEAKTNMTVFSTSVINKYIAHCPNQASHFGGLPYSPNLRVLQFNAAMIAEENFTAT